LRFDHVHHARVGPLSESGGGADFGSGANALRHAEQRCEFFAALRMTRQAFLNAISLFYFLQALSQ
jgi:hypothetical protein